MKTSVVYMSDCTLDLWLSKVGMVSPHSLVTQFIYMTLDNY